MLLRLDDGSRMSREAHVRFCEGLGGKFPWSTHPYLHTEEGWLYLAVIIDLYSRIEPPRESRRLFGVSHAAMAASSRCR